jgi:hypothetical protein
MRFGKKSKLVVHRTLAILGVLSGLAGISTMVIFKLLQGYPHLKTPHSWAGALGVVLLLVTPVLGYLVTKGHAKLRWIHKLCGRLGILFGLTAVTTGLIRLFL